MEPADRQKVSKKYDSWIKNLQVVSNRTLHLLFYSLVSLIILLVYLYGVGVFLKWYTILLLILWSKTINEIGKRVEHKEGYLSGYEDGFEDGQWHARGISEEEANEYKRMKQGL